MSNLTQPISRGRSKLATIGLWLLAGTAIAGVLGLLLSHAPPRLRLIGILAGVQGAFCGWLMSLAGKPLRMRFLKSAAAGGAVLGAAGTALTTTLWWQAHARQLEASYEPPKGAAMAAAILNQAGEPTDSKARKEIQEYREALKEAGALPPDSSFPAYLEFRASSIGQGRTGGQILFAAELLLAAILCAGFARLSAGKPFCTSCGDWVLPIRSHEFSGEHAAEIAELAGAGSEAYSRAEVTLSQCRCDGQRPQVVILLELAGDRTVRRLSTTSDDSSRDDAPLLLSEEAISQLAARIDAAQGLRQTGS